MLGIVVAVTCKHGKERGSNDVWVYHPGFVEFIIYVITNFELQL